MESVGFWRRPGGRSDDELAQTIRELGRLGAILAAERNRLIGDWDRRGAWRATGAKSASAALASIDRAPKTECGARIRLERSLRHLPLVRDAYRAGDIGEAHADGTRHRVINVSYRRTFDGALRDLIKVRDQLCYHHTCDEPAHRCQVDHIQPWAAGGITAQDNGQLACGFHNRLRARQRRSPPLE